MPSREEQDRRWMERAAESDKNLTCQSYWYPRLPADVPVPKTMMVPFRLDVQVLVLDASEERLDEASTAKLHAAIKGVEDAAALFKFPLFIKTGIFSDKHNWNCFVASPDKLRRNLVDIIYNWFCVGGIENSNWIVIREMIPTKPFLLWDEKMPVTREWRYFVEDGKIFWRQPYWPRRAFPSWATTDLLGHESIEQALEIMNEEKREDFDRLSALALSINKSIPGAWSIDFLQDVDGKWWLIDMAEAPKSFIDREYPHGRRWLE